MSRITTAGAAIVLSAALVGAGVTPALAAYPAQPKVAVKITKPKASLKVGKAFTLSGKSVKGAKVVITFGKTQKRATKKGASLTVGKSGKFTPSFRIMTTGTYYVKVVVKKTGKASVTKFYKVKVKV